MHKLKFIFGVVLGCIPEDHTDLIKVAGDVKTKLMITTGKIITLEESITILTRLSKLKIITIKDGKVHR